MKTMRKLWKALTFQKLRSTYRWNENLLISLQGANDRIKAAYEEGYRSGEDAGHKRGFQEGVLEGRRIANGEKQQETR